MLYKRKKKTLNRIYSKSACPMADYGFTCTRIDNHLIKIHKVNHDDALQMARSCPKIQTAQMHNTSNAESYAERFLNYISSFEGGFYIDRSLDPHIIKRNEAANKKMANHIKKILELAFGIDKDINDQQLFGLKFIGRDIGTQKSVISQLKLNNTYQTVRNYLQSLQHFYSYLSSQSPATLTQQQLNSMTQSLTSVRRTVWRHCKDELQKKKIDDHDAIIPLDHLKRWYMAKIYSESLNLKDHVTDMETASRLRNKLLLHCSLANVKRTGIIEALTVHHLQKASIDKHKGYRLLIHEGKTFSCSGSAGVYFSAEEFQALKNYEQFARPFFSPTTDQVFCKKDGSWASGSDILRMAQTA